MWAAAFCIFLACSTLPDYARPRGELLDPSAYHATDVIRYRELSRADFRGDSPPRRVASHASKLGAFTCANIVATPTTVMPTITPDPPSGGFVARAPALRYRAEMDRGCSWWNPDGAESSETYTLQHEQIHFAIVELEARRLDEEARGLLGRGSSPEAAAAALQRSINAALQAALSRGLSRSTRFDEDTSLVHDPRAQSRWNQRVVEELGQLDEPGRSLHDPAARIP